MDSKCLFWDFDFGWAGSNHDWSVFQKTEIGKKFLHGKFKPYKLIGNATYPMRPCFILPFKGSKSGLSREKQYWNFIQSSTMMVVERAFGILKRRWQILLKRIDIPLHNVPDVVIACICLHNLGLIYTDGFDMRWAKQTEEEIEKTRVGVFGKFHNNDMFHIVKTSIKQMQSLQKPKVSIQQIVEDGSDYGSSGDKLEDSSRTKKHKEKKIKMMLFETTKFHESMAQIFYDAMVQKHGDATLPTSEEDSE